MQQGGSFPVDCAGAVQANAMRLELQLMVQAEVERAQHAAMMAAAWDQPQYLGLAHPDPQSLERRRTARYLYADLGSGGKSRWRGDWSRSRMWEHLRETAVLTDGEKEFQNLCRLPREIFEEIVEAAVRSGRFAAPDWECRKYGAPPTTHRRMQHQVVPLRLQVMMSLRHLATGEPFASVAMAGFVGKDTVRNFFHRFTEWMVDHYYADKVTGRSGIGFDSVSDVEKAEHVFRKLGLPSIVTCMDGVHVAWDRAPFDVKYKFVGKEGFPTVAWNVHVDAVGVIKYIAPQQFGAANDKTQVRRDALVHALRTAPLFTEREWRVQGGDPDKIVGTSTLCDGGYHAWLATIAAPKYPIGHDEVKWASRCESVRKIVERTFGMLKKRFRVLRLPMLYNRGTGGGFAKLDNVFKTCCLLHNWLMQHRGLDTMGTQPADWMEPSPDEITARQRIYDLVNGQVRMFDGQSFVVTNSTDMSRVGGCQNAHPNYDKANRTVCMAENEDGYFERRDLLVRHFAAARNPHFVDTVAAAHTDDVPLWLRTAAQARPC